MAFELIFDDPIVRITFSGSMTVDDLAALAAELYALEATRARTPDRLTDLTAVEARDSTFKMIIAVARRRSTMSFPNSFRSAIVAPTPGTAGFARMFKILNRNPQIDIRIFDTVEQAEAWLHASAASGQEQ